VKARSALLAPTEPIASIPLLKAGPMRDKFNIPPEVREELRHQAELLRKLKLKNPLANASETTKAAFRKMAEDLAKVRSPLIERRQAPKVISPPAAELSITTTPPTVVRTKKHKKHKKHQSQQGSRLDEVAAHLFPNGYPPLLALSDPELRGKIYAEYERRAGRHYPRPAPLDAIGWPSLKPKSPRQNFEVPRQNFEVPRQNLKNMVC
jgi:hypothetical protein